MSQAEHHEAECCGHRGAGAGAGRREPFAFPGTTRKYARDRVVDVRHIRLELEVDPAHRRIAGVARHRVASLVEACATVAFEAVELSIDAVTDERGRALEHRLVDGTLTIHLAEPLAAGAEETISIAYHGRPRRGLWFIGPDAGYPDKPVQVWSQGQDEDARWWFPCFDDPQQKATTELLVTAPSKYATLSNGALVGKSPGATKGTTTWHWRLGIPHATYLVTLVVGEFDEVALPGGRVPLTALVPKGRARDAQRCLGRTGEMVKAFEARFGVPYPYEKYAQAVVADFIFGGMENTSATTLTEYALYDERAGLDYDADDLIAHELAHQWWGDLLTCRDWSHAWLNEGFATWSEELFREHHLGVDEATIHVLGAAKRYFAEDGGEYRRPIVSKDYEEPIDVFDRHLYEKGGWVLRMLRAELGEEGFWRAIRRYAETNQGRSVVTDDLRRAVEEATGRNVERFLDQWIFGAGHPEFKASWAFDETARVLTVRLEQGQKGDETTASAFQGTMTVEVVTGGGVERHRLAITERVHAFHLPTAARPDLVRFDPEARWLAVWNLDVGLDAHRRALAGDPYVAMRIRAATALAKDQGAETVAALGKALREDRFWGVRAEAAAALGQIRTPGARQTLLDALGQVEHPKARRAVVAALGAFRGEEAAAEALLGVLRKGDPSLFVEAEAAEALGKTRSPRARAALEQALARKDSWGETIRAACVRGLAHLATEEVVPTLIDRLAWGQHARVRTAACGALAQVGVRLVVRDRVREALEEAVEDRDFRVQMAAIASLRGLGDDRALPALRRAAAHATDGRVRRACRGAARRIEQRAERTTETTKLAEAVEALRGEVARLHDRLQKAEAARTSTPKKSAGAASAGRARGKASPQRAAAKATRKATPSTSVRPPTRRRR